MDSSRIAAPRPPEPSPSFKFPVLATVAPVAAAVTMWVITASPFALMFAALGPITALASLADSRIGSRRARGRELRRFEAETRDTRSAIVSAHALERLAVAEATPSARAILAVAGADPCRWRATTSGPVMVALGTGEVPSALQLERPARQPIDSAEVVAALDGLAAAARMLDAAPVTVDARLGIGIHGSKPLVTAVARAIALQLAWALSPADYWAAGAEDEWMSLLPHPQGAPPTRRGVFAEFGGLGQNDALVTVAVAASGAELPGACGIVLRVGGEEGSAIVRHPDRVQRRAVRVEAVSLDEAASWARFATAEAEREGIVSAESRMPPVAELGPLLGAGGPALAVAVAVDADGPVVVDLVTHGPHAVVGGTTGSGKSELLIAWVVAMAAAHSPEVVNFLLIDFKGGSAFGVLAGLPHTVGIITDLDEREAARALASLRAELRHRERFLADASARSIEALREEAPGLPRLVIVVDEFAAMLVDHPELHALFADLAARGRSLGVHLVLCTQRPAGAVRDAVLANADLRVSLRVNNRADSSAVVGTDAAADIPARARGRGIVSLAGGQPRLVQFALANAVDVQSAASRWPGSRTIRRPWCEPLPPLVPLAALHRAAEGIAFGLVDLPDEQRIATATWTPARDGSLLVLGAPRSGKSVALETLAQGALRGADGGTDAAGSEHAGWQVIWLPSSVDAAWDVLSGLSAARDRLLLVDDLDSVLSRFGADHRAVVVERLAALLRDGPGRGIHLAVTAQRLTAELQQLAGLMPARLMLAHPSRQDFMLAGGESAQYVAELPPGGGSWRGRTVQVASGADRRPADPAPSIASLDSRPLAIVSARARALAPRLGTVVELADAGPEVAAYATGDGTPVLLGDVEEWQSHWGAIAALRPVADILFDACSVADYRALTRARELPPPILGPDIAWRLEPDGTTSRVRLPLDNSDVSDTAGARGQR